MPLSVPAIDGRTYEELRAEALRRIPVHNPLWTNFNASDPGVTLVEVFAFMTESLLYSANRIPARNHQKFLSLLGIPLYPATSAHGIVTLTNEQGPLSTLTLERGVEVLAGQVPFHTDTGLDVLPFDARVYVKRRRPADQATIDRYQQLYASYADADGLVPPVSLYQTELLAGDGGIDLADETVDGSLWIALLLRQRDKDPRDRDTARRAIAGKVLSLGVVPIVDDREARLGPVAAPAATVNQLRYSMPDVTAATERTPEGAPGAGSPQIAYVPLAATDPRNVLTGPGIVQLVLPDADRIATWRRDDPLEAGVGNRPPALDDVTTERVLTWIRVEAGSAQHTRILWAGVNAATVTQRAPVEDEALADGTGDPDQVVRLARRPVVPGSVRLEVTVGDRTEAWTEVEDLMLGGPELPLQDPTRAPGSPAVRRARSEVFVLDPEAGELRFGDGEHGRRPPPEALLRASYDVSDGTAGNVTADAITSGPSLPPGIKVTNPVKTWGGNDAEQTASGERRITSFLRHGERLVTADDHERIAEATPEVEVGRVEVLPAFDPGLGPNEPGDAPGAVTLLVIPKVDLVHPDAPRPDGFFLDAVCRHLDRRRLVTSELFLRGPEYVPVWVSVGIEVSGSRSISETREAVKRALIAFLSPLPTVGTDVPPFAHRDVGWPLRYPVQVAELTTIAGRADGVLFVTDLLLGGADATPVDKRIELRGLRLPRLAGISVVAGDPVPLADLQGTVAVGVPAMAVPASPEAC